MTESATWPWMFYSTSIAQVVLIVGCFVFFRETYAPLILQRRAERLRRNTQNDSYYTASERQHANRTFREIFQRNLSRPLRLLAFHPIIQIMGLLSAFGYGVLYIVLSTFSNLWTSHYHQSTSTSGLHVSPTTSSLLWETTETSLTSIVVPCCSSWRTRRFSDRRTDDGLLIPKTHQTLRSQSARIPHPVERSRHDHRSIGLATVRLGCSKATAMAGRGPGHVHRLLRLASRWPG